ncbi:hypothetical protein B296_00006833 [Ensete ventricosum]|uniref:Uncharacterized protein n=1 Tax=Ensete ventricosum TaxID=4639 RepID=A0A427A194_ENSVE|nr:hypothetical protein B296_00006833 [Ensete ventricosum]
MMEAATAEGGVVVIREYAAERDRVGVEAVERRCEVAPSGGGMCLYTDLLGDPLCRVRHSPPFLMLVRTPLFIFFVAEVICGSESREIVGIVRGCIKTVACGTQKPHRGTSTTTAPLTSLARHHTAPSPIYAKVAYLLGLRVSPAHR